jgi:AraC family transcriptional activator of pobA
MSNFTLGQDKFRIYKINSKKHESVSYKRRDYFKISLLTAGTGMMYFSGTPVRADKATLTFFNPLLAYSWEPTSKTHSGYTVLFTADFLPGPLRKPPLFASGLIPLYTLDKAAVKDLVFIFEKMIAIDGSDYAQKNELLSHYIQLIVHEGLRLQKVPKPALQNNAAERITRQFFDLLWKQFPVTSPDEVIQLKNPSHYADALHVHINHLNQSIQTVSGKNTTWHIQQKLTGEAKMLLMQTDWPVADIAYSLGFEYPSYFNRFFKKQTGLTPLSFRK